MGPFESCLVDQGSDTAVEFRVGGGGVGLIKFPPTKPPLSKVKAMAGFWKIAWLFDDFRNCNVRTPPLHLS